MRVGVEVGGTFTDLIATDGREIRVAKVPSVPAQPEKGVLAALTAAGIKLADVHDLVHGSTVATNAVLERKGGRIAFITTAGFTDLLLIQRQDRPRIYQLVYKKPAAIVGRADTLGIEERVLADGSVVTPLDKTAAAKAVRNFLSRDRYQAVAICLLNAYANPTHELTIADLIRTAFPDISISCSHAISGEFREYERASTTVLSAYVQPTIDGYLKRLESELAREGFAGRFSVMQSNGGQMPAGAMQRSAITALYSGPAAGVTGAIRQSRLSGYKNLITFDMGGTSTDVCLITGGRPAIASQTDVGGLPVRMPVIDIATVGAGGGSIVWRDEGGMLRVGPQSSGADPGPACYGRGGKAPTLTDAHVIRGTLPTTAPLGGTIRLDVAAARLAFRELAACFSMTEEEIADSAIRVADANIVRAIQLVSTERGIDPRDYVVVSFGGAGPLHAGRIAEELGLSTIVVPRNAGVLSAYGLIAADFAQFETATRRIPLDERAPDAVREVFGTLRQRMLTRFSELGISGVPTFTQFLQMRFAGQAFELDVPIAPDKLAALTTDNLRAAFQDIHHQIYFHAGGSRSSKQIEIVGFHIGATAPAASGDLPISKRVGTSSSREQTVHEYRERRICRQVERDALDSGVAQPGPALICDPTATIYVPPKWSATRDAVGNLVMQREL